MFVDADLRCPLERLQVETSAYKCQCDRNLRRLGQVLGGGAEVPPSDTAMTRISNFRQRTKMHKISSCFMRGPVFVESYTDPKETETSVRQALVQEPAGWTCASALNALWGKVGTSRVDCHVLASCQRPGQVKLRLTSIPSPARAQVPPQDGRLYPRDGGAGDAPTWDDFWAGFLGSWAEARG